MTSERLQRRIERLLDEADQAIDRSDWDRVRDRATNVLRLDPENSDALALIRAAEQAFNPQAIPPGLAPYKSLLRRNANLVWSSLLIAGIFAIAFVVRLYHLGSEPNNLTADETDFLRDIYAILDGSGFSWFYQGQAASLLPIGAGLMSLSVRVFGNSIAGLRMYSVILSILTLSLFFLLSRQQRMSLLSAATATLLLSTNIWFLNFSRTAWPNMNAALLAVGMFASLSWALEKKDLRWFAAAGVFVGLAPWAYVSARVLPAVFLAICTFALWLRGRERKALLSGFAVTGLVALLVASPVLFKLTSSKYRDAYMLRTKAVSIFTGRSPSDAWQMAADNAWAGVQGFILLSNSDGILGTDNIFRRSTEGNRYAPRDHNLVDPVGRILIGLGMVVSLRDLRRYGPWWLMLIIPGAAQIFSVGTPDAARGLILLPFLFLFLALGLDTLLGLSRRLFAASTPRRVLLQGSIVLAVAALLSVLSLRTYFDWMQTDYALEDRGPYVLKNEFREWSALQRESVRLGEGTLNTGGWRERQDKAGCFTGLVMGHFCSHIARDTRREGLGAVLLNESDVGPPFRLQLRTEIEPEEFVLIHGGRNETLRGELASGRIYDAWAAVFTGDGQAITSSVAHLATPESATGIFTAKNSLGGETYLGGPTRVATEITGMGQQAVLLTFALHDTVWWEYFWRQGSYVASVQLRAPRNSQTLSLEVFNSLRSTALIQADRMIAIDH